MKFITKIIYIYVHVLMICLIKLAYAEDIKILVDRPNVITSSTHSQKYELIKKYMPEKYKSYNLIFDYDVNPTSVEKSVSYEEYYKQIAKELKDTKYDMLVINGNTLFADDAEIESGYAHETADIRKMHRYFEDLTSYISKDKISFHNETILKGGYHENKLYALPFEADFDVIFYRRDSPNLRGFNLRNSTWDALFNDNYKHNETYSLGIPFDDEQEMIYFFVEYFNNEIDLKNDFSKLYTEDSRNLIKKFVEYIVKTESNEHTLKDIHDEYQNNARVFFKGKASYFATLRNEYRNTTATLLPNDYTILEPKYLVINKNSKIDKRTLVDIALQITSKKVQLEKAKQFGCIPTFNLSVEDEVPNYKIYDLFNKMKIIDIKDIFMGGKSAPYVETRMLLPEVIKDLIGLSKVHTVFSNVLENVKKVLFEKIGIGKYPFYVFNIPLIVFLVYALIFIGLVIKHRNHPHMKLFSPNFCIIIIIAIAMRVIHISNKLVINNPKLCKYIYIYESLYTDLCLFPMVAVTYRIYKIFCNKKFDANRNLNKNIVIFFIGGMLVMICYSCICANFFLEFFIESSGRITTYRQPYCNNDGHVLLESVERRVNEIIYVVMVYMVIRTGRVSKKFGEFKYVYIMFLTGIIEYIREALIKKIPKENFYWYHILIIVVCMLVDALFIYFLVGSRIIYAMKHPEQIKKYADNTEYATDYLTNFEKKEGNNQGSTYRNQQTQDSEFDFVYDCTNNNYPSGLASFDSNNLLSSNTAVTSNNDYYNPNTMNYSNVNNISMNNMDVMDVSHMDMNMNGLSPHQNGFSQQSNGLSHQNGFSQQSNGLSHQNGFSQQSNGLTPQQNGFSQQSNGNNGFSQNTTDSYYYNTPNHSNSLLIPHNSTENKPQQKNHNYFGRILKGLNGISSEQNDMLSNNTIRTNMAQVDFTKSNN